MELLCWGTRNSGIESEGQGSANKCGCIVSPLPTLQPGVPKEGETLHSKPLHPPWASLGDDFSKSCLGPGKPKGL